MMNALRDIVQHNLLVKICALVIAILLWLYVMNDQNPAIEGSYSIPVSMADAPDGYRMHASAETVTIRVRAAFGVCRGGSRRFPRQVEFRGLRGGR